MSSDRSVRKMLARAGPILKRLPAGRPVMVEIGIFKAQMAEYLLAQRPDLIWHGVDDWLQQAEQPLAYVKTEDIHALASAEQQAKWYAIAEAALVPFAGRATVHEMRSVEAAGEFEDESVDLVFADGDHSYIGCLADLEAWWPVVKSGGWLGGHDINNPDPRFRYGVNKAVADFGGDVGLQPVLDGGHTYFFRKP